MTEIALIARAQLLTDPFDYDKYPELAAHETNAILELSGIRTFWPDLEPLIEAAHKTTNWYEQLVEAIEHADAGFDLTEQEFQARAAEQLAGPVLGDVGPTRVIDFQALGVRWIVEFDNDRTTVLTAEGFVAALQIILADIALMNPVLINSTVRITVKVRPGASHDADSIDIDDSEPEVVANVNLSGTLDDLDARERAVVATCYQLLHAVHVRPPKDLQDLLEPLFKGGLIHKVSARIHRLIAPGHVLIQFLDEDRFRRREPCFGHEDVAACGSRPVQVSTSSGVRVCADGRV